MSVIKSFSNATQSASKFLQSLTDKIEKYESTGVFPLAKLQIPTNKDSALDTVIRWFNDGHLLTIEQKEALKELIADGAEGISDSAAAAISQLPEAGPFVAAVVWLIVNGFGMLLESIIDDLNYEAIPGIPVDDVNNTKPMPMLGIKPVGLGGAVEKMTPVDKTRFEELITPPSQVIPRQGWPQYPTPPRVITIDVYPPSTPGVGYFSHPRKKWYSGQPNATYPKIGF